MPASRGALPCLVIGGPTACGKSALARDLAVALDGVVINGDSMQIYDALPILTAQPTDRETKGVPHRLYGVLPPAEGCSVGRWRSLALAEIATAHEAGKLPIVVGGSGLYLRGLMEGLAAIPEVPPAIRAETESLFAIQGAARFHQELAARDPLTASRLVPGDSQRLKRAWAVLEATGRPLSAWLKAGSGDDEAAPAMGFVSIVMAPPRAALYAACDARFEAMVAAGALEEARHFAALGLDPGLPLMKAVGLAPLCAHLRGEAPLTEAIALGQQATRRYAKRQTTWFRHQARPDICLEALYGGAAESDGIARKNGPSPVAEVMEFLLTLKG